MRRKGPLKQLCGSACGSDYLSSKTRRTEHQFTEACRAWRYAQGSRQHCQHRRLAPRADKDIELYISAALTLDSRELSPNPFRKLPRGVASSRRKLRRVNIPYHLKRGDLFLPEFRYHSAAYRPETRPAAIAFASSEEMNCSKPSSAAGSRYSP